MLKIHCRLAGGLGNQIFQYGASLIISKKSHVHDIELDDSELNNYKAARNNELLNYFRLENTKISKSAILKLRLPRIRLVNAFTSSFVGDLNFSRLANVSLNAKNYYLDGYFQTCLDQSLFDSMLSLLKEDFIYSHLNVKKNICAIHIRGGDFLTEKYSGVASLDYYCDSLAKIKELNAVDKYIIVTDDKDYASSVANRMSLDYTFSDGSMLNDFLLIAQSEVKVLSNSTFSIWASALGYQPGCIIFAPKKLTIHDNRNFTLPGELR